MGDKNPVLDGIAMWELLYHNGAERAATVHAVEPRAEKTDRGIPEPRSCQNCGLFDCKQQGVICSEYFYEPGSML